MKIDDELIDKLATLARLEFQSHEKAEIREDLGKIISFVEKINELDLTGVEPMIYVNEEINVMRTDEIIHDISQDEALKNAPKKDSDYFKVPKVLSK
jgi:aspartyl-tRNA(Asn)/glutamyl-tRNA(Gln) amidotransferase subunit C